MATLTLTLKKKWFDMIKSGVKTEEYREIKPFWTKRLVRQVIDYVDGRISIPDVPREFDTLVFTLGYPKADDMSRRMVFKNPKVEIRTGNPEWGAEKDKVYYVITWS
jgi:hypothetical protein